MSRKPPIPKTIFDNENFDKYTTDSWHPEDDPEVDVRQTFVKIKNNLEKDEVVCFPESGLQTWSNLPEFAIMDQDIRPTYKKHIVKGFDRADRVTKDHVRRMNEFTVTIPPRDLARSC